MNVQHDVDQSDCGGGKECWMRGRRERRERRERKEEKEKEKKKEELRWSGVKSPKAGRHSLRWLRGLAWLGLWLRHAGDGDEDGQPPSPIGSDL
jgi:hypothetical protein